jgi:diguanylate cyclase (GGDEF)-like protein
MTEGKVVVVNDEKASLSQAEDFLTKAGFEVSSCAGGFDALHQLCAEGADVLVSATDLTDLDGYQLSCLIKCNDRTQQLPVVLVKTSDDNPDSFWSAAAMADSLVDLTELKTGDKLVNLAKSLIERSKGQGWKPSMTKESSLASGLLSSKELLNSYQLVVNNLLIERLVGRLARSLMDVTAPRKKFLDQYFTLVSRLFNSQISGLVLSSTANPWASFQVGDGVSKKSFDDLVKKISKEMSTAKDLSLDLRGQLLEDGGKTISTPEVLYVKRERVTLGALIFSTAQKKGFDQASRTAMAELQIQMGPVFRLLQANQEIETLHQQEQFRASTDSLTGLYNLEFLVGFLQQQLLFSFRQRSPVGLLIIDIDHLQNINDEFGYEIGDLVLSTIANRLLNQTRSSDLMARYGGDEFAVVLPNTDVAGGKILAEKIRLEVEQMSFVKGPGRKGPHVTVSVGCANFNMEDLNPETILRDAKMSLKRAKELGGNQSSA